MRRRRPTNPVSFWLDCNAVIAKRLTLIGQGGAAGQREAIRMVTEKMQAATRANLMLLAGRTPDQVLRMLSRRVKANRRRL